MLPHRQLFVCLLPYNRSRFNKALKFVIDSWTSARLKWNINWEALDCNLMISMGNIVKLMKNLFCQNIKGICHIFILIPFLDVTVLHSKYVAFRPNWNKSVCHELTKLYYKTLRGKMANITSLTWVPEFQKKIQNQILNQYLGRNVDLRTIFKGIKYGVKTSTIYIRPIWHLWRQRLLLYSNISPILTSIKLQQIWDGA